MLDHFPAKSEIETDINSSHLKQYQREKLFFFVFCLVLVFLIYGRTLGGDFVFDDRYVAESSHIFLLNNLPQIITSPYWSTESGLYRPVTVISYAFNYSLFGAEPWSFHFLNLIFYAWSCYLIFLLVEQFFKKRMLAMLSAVLFLVLTIHSEAVANIIGRAEILALFFSLLFFLEIARPKTRPALAGLWLILALGSKEIGSAALPLGLMLITFKDKDSENIKTEYKSFFTSVLMGLIYFGARLQVLGFSYFKNLETSLVENPLKFAPLLPRIATAFKILAMYVQKSIWPFGLCSDYSYNQIPVLKNFWHVGVLLGLAIFILFCGAIIFFWKRQPILAWAAAVFVLGFLIIGNIFFPTGTIAGERLVYYPSLGLVIFLAYLLGLTEKIKPRLISKIILLTAGMGLIGFYGWQSYQRSLDWLTEKKLFASAAKCAPNSVLSRSNLGAAYYQAGDILNAKKELLAAEKIYNGYPKGLNNLGLVYWKENQKEKAKEYFLKALDFKFPYPGAYENLALMALEENNLPEARKWLMFFYSGNHIATEAYIQNHLPNKTQKNY